MIVSPELAANPLLHPVELPPYATIRAEHIAPAIEHHLAAAQAAVALLLSQHDAPTWDNTELTLMKATQPLAWAWGIVAHLHSVLADPELRLAYQKQLPEVSEFWAALGQNIDLYERYKTLAASDHFQTLTHEQQTVIKHSLRDFRLSGADLNDADKATFLNISTESDAISSQFSEHVQDATDAWSMFVSADELAGLPEAKLTQLAHDATQYRAANPDCAAQADYRLTLQMPCYLAVMQYADNRDLRETMYRAYGERASEFGPAAWDNSPLIKRRCDLAQQEAHLLGFDTYAHLSTHTKMAQNPKTVLDFLQSLATHSKPYAEQDLADLQAYAKRTGITHTIEPWDVAYLSERYRLAAYDVSSEAIKSYFPLPKVLSGLFQVIHTLFDVTCELDASVATWHADGQFYRVKRQGELIGGLYLDLFARTGKRPGAWMNDVQSRQRWPQGPLQLPIALIVCNFEAPIGHTPSTLTHDDMCTLFHEFGHALHHVLTTVNESAIAGINGVAWDAVELPSQLMENFCWEWPVLQSMSEQQNPDASDVGQPLPRALFDKMLAAKHFQSGLQMVRQLEFSLFDMHVYLSPVDASFDYMAILNQVRDLVAVIKPPVTQRFPNAFSHIFGGGYAAGYYSYKWAEVLSADVYAAFEEAGGANPDTGLRFLNTILSQGSSRPAMDLFVAFRGREPTTDALLRHSGMTPNTASASL